MAFVQSGTVSFPEIPSLEVQELWRGIGDDEHRLLLKIASNRAWANKRYVIVLEYRFIYSLVDDEGNFPTLNPSGVNTERGFTRGNHASWRNEGGSTLHYDLQRGWVIDNSSWGEGKYYQVYFDDESAEASPVGWEEGEEPDDVDFHFDWPRWECSRGSWGTARPDDNYTPASRNVDTPVSGNIRVGCASWTNSTYGVLCRGAEKPFVSYKLVSSGQVLTVDAQSIVCTLDGINYMGDVPQPEQDYTLVSESGLQTLVFYWNGWIEGISEHKDWLCEMGRMF